MAIMYGKLVPVTALHQMYISISSLMAHEGLGVAEVVRLGMTKILPHESICLFIIVILWKGRAVSIFGQEVAGIHTYWKPPLQNYL